MPIVPDRILPEPEERKTPSKEEKKAAPHTRVRSGGKVNRRLRTIADMYLANHPEMAVRWVYSPLHKPELSNVIDRQIDGYVMIYVKDLGTDTVEFMPGVKADEPARVGDTILMAIAAAEQREIQAGLDAAAADEYGRVEEEFQGAVEDIALAKGMKEEYRVRPMGRSVTELVERDVEGPESHKEA